MAAGAGRILTTHVGGLGRPDELLAFIVFQQEGKPSDVVKKQTSVGVDIVSDGEYGKSSWSPYILDRLIGFEERHDKTPGFRSAVAGKDRRDFAEFYEEYEGTYGFVGMGKAFKTGTWVVTGPIKYTGQALIQRDISDVKRAATGSGAVDAFLPLVVPASVVPQCTDEHYKSEDDALFAIAVRIAKLVGCERVVASTDCGFAQGPFARRIHPQIMWAKLGALAEGARIATKQLWN